MNKIRSKFCSLLLLLATIVSCTDSTNKSSNQIGSDQNLSAKTQILWKHLLAFDNDSILNNSPMRLYAHEFNSLTNRVIEELDESEFENNKVFEKIMLLRYKANTYKIDDSLTKEIDTLLAFRYGKKYTNQELERRVLKSNYLFMKEMLTALERIHQHEDVFPYMISGDEKIIVNQDMRSVIIIPKKEIIHSISFVSPNDSMMVDYQNDHFIWVLATPRSKHDSISAVIKLKNIEKEIVLTKHYEVIQ